MTPRPTAGGTVQRLAVSLRPRWRLLTLVAILVAISASLELVPPLVLRAVVDDHLLAGRADGLLPLAALYLGAVAAVEVSRALAGYLTSVAAQGTLHDLRVRLFRHLQSLPIAWFDRTPLGEAIARCTSDVEAIQTMFSTGVSNVLIDLARLVTISVALVALSPPLAGISALALPPLIVITRVLQVRIRAAVRANRDAIGHQSAQLQETLAGAETIRTFGRETAFVDRFRVGLTATLTTLNRSTALSVIYNPNVTLLAAVTSALLLWVGARGMLADWGVSPGTLTAFVLLLQRAFTPLAALGEEWQTVQEAFAGAERVFDLLAEPTEETGGTPPTLIGAASDAPTGAVGASLAAPCSPPPLSNVPTGATAFLDGVTFGYAAGRPVLRDVSLSIWPGEHVALVGRTGAGKTSALALLGGLYRPWDGRVRIQAHDPRDLSAEQRCHLLGVVPQTALLFNGTVIENLTLFDPDVSRGAVEQTARLAGASRFIEALPAGYDTMLAGVGGGSGVRLSAGQAALLALARALIWDPPLLLFDEATAAIDSASEDALRNALRAGLAGERRALLTVAHRLSTAREADRVIVLEGGRLVEEGAPDALIARGGRFATLVELEAAGWDWQEAPPNG